MINQSHLTAREIQAEFQIGKALLPISQVTLTHTIDELPHAVVTVQLDNGGSPDPVTRRFGAVAMNIDKFNALTRATQEKILNNYQVDPDTQLVIRDGEHDPNYPNDGHELRLKGFLGRPEFRIREGEVFLNFSLVHAKAVLQAMNTRIYGAQEHYSFTVPRQFFNSPANEGVIQGDSIADRVKVIIDGMISGFVAIPNSADSSLYDALPMHNLNLTVLDKVHEFLKLSSETTKIPGIGEPNFENENILWTLWNALIDAPNFFHAISYLNAEFMLQLNADYEGSAWLEWSQVNTDIGKREIAVPLENVVFNMANIFQLPILQVLVQANGMDLYGFAGDVGVLQGQVGAAPIPLDIGRTFQTAIVQTGDNNIQMTSLTRWPPAIPKNAVGTIYLISPPRWINPELSTYQSVSQSRAFIDSQSSTKFGAMCDAVLNEKKYFQGAAAVRDKVMTYMAKQQFRKLYLEATSAQITAPLNLRVRPGYHYLVASITGETLFTGYLVSVNHDITMGSQGSAAATTTMAFTHVKAPGAVINALQDNPTFPTATIRPVLSLQPSATLTDISNIA